MAREATYVVQIIHPNEERFEKNIRELVAIYKEQSQQESVLRVTARSCVSFSVAPIARTEQNLAQRWLSQTLGR